MTQTDESPFSDAAIRAIEERFAKPEVLVHVLLVVAKFVPPPAALLDAGGSPKAARAEVVSRFRTLVQAAAERLRARGLVVDAIVKDGNPGRVIVKEAKEWGADLIVIGAPSHNRLERLVVGSVPQYVLNHTPCSVEIVHGEESKSNV